jgi:hypothetical protein
MGGIVGLVIGIAMAVWVYNTVKRKGGDLPWLWAIGTFFIWPIFVTIVGFKYNEGAMKIVGIIGLVLIVVGVGFVLSI